MANGTESAVACASDGESTSDFESIALPVLCIQCGGHRFEVMEDQWDSFEVRAGPTFFAALKSDSPSSSMFGKAADGSFLLEGVNPEAFARVWAYLLSGARPAMSTASEVARFRWTSDFFCIKGALLPWTPASVILTSGGYMAHPQLLPGGLIAVGEPLLTFVQRKPSDYLDTVVDVSRQSLAAASIDIAPKRSSLLAEVELRAVDGTVLLRLPGQASVMGWQPVASHAQLKDKRLICALVRRSICRSTGQEGYLVLIHVAPTRYVAEALSRPEVAKCPCSWVSLRLRVQRLRDAGSCGLEFLRLEHLRMSPGWIAELQSGTVIVMEHGNNLRKMKLVVYHARSGGVDQHTSATLELPGLVATVTAPRPYHPYTRDFKGKGKGDANHAKGWGKGQGRDRDTPVVTLDASGRALQTLWAVENEGKLVVLLHAADGRLCIGKIDDVDGIIPKPHQGSQVHAPENWDLWGRQNKAHTRRWSDVLQTNRLFSHGERRPLSKISIRKRFNVPCCHKILAILPRADSILILHQSGAPKCTPKTAQGLWTVKLWRVAMPQRDACRSIGDALTEFPTFDGYGVIRLNIQRRITVTELGGSWFEDKWGTRDVEITTFPHDAVDELWPALVDVGDFEAPKGLSTPGSSEVLRWKLVEPHTVTHVHREPDRGTTSSGKGKLHGRTRNRPHRGDPSSSGLNLLSSPSTTHFVATDLKF